MPEAENFIQSGAKKGEERVRRKKGGSLRRLRERLLEVFYPRRCPVCAQIVTPRGALVHEECREKLLYVREPACKRCGRQLAQPEREYCGECAGRDFHYLRGYAVWQYEEHIKRSLSEFKYHSRKEFADFYAREALRLYRAQIEREKPDVLIPVPVHSTRRAERGFNQAELIARRIGEAAGIPVDAHYLLRTKRTERLKELDRRERKKMLKDAFGVDPAKKAGYRSVMLVDDIYTTGSTIDACAAALQRAGVERVTFLSMAVGASAN